MNWLAYPPHTGIVGPKEIASGAERRFVTMSGEDFDQAFKRGPYRSTGPTMLRPSRWRTDNGHDYRSQP